MARSGPPATNWRGLADRFWSTSRINRVALGAGVLWSVLVLSYAGGYFGGTGGGGTRGTAFLDAVFFLVALLLPLGLVALAAWLAAELARQRATVDALVAAAAPLAEALEATREALGRDGPRPPEDTDRLLRAALGETRAELQRDLTGAFSAAMGEVREGQRRLDGTVARIEALLGGGEPPPAAAAPPRAALRRGLPARMRPAEPAPPAPPPPAAEEEPALPELAAEPEEPLDWDDLVRALDFPRDAEDEAGFAALRRALRRRNLQQMLQAAEDVLNLLSQDGVFMDDLEHRPGPAWAWRAFADGRRGDAVGAAGGMRDPGALDAVRRLMRSDPIFRDAVLVFQRRFDAVLAEIARDADDAGLLQVADTRTGRAFQLCARVCGAFD